MERLVLPDGRTIEYLVEGPPGGMPLVMHHGTPGAALRYGPAVDAATRHGLRFVQHSRPGYGDSTPQPGRRVADVAADVAALVDALGATTFVTAGESGGGPHALACAALLPQRCLAAATIAGVAPYDAEGLTWLDGMGAENVEEFGAAVAGIPALEAFLSRGAAGISTVRGSDLAAALGDLVSEVDRRALTGEFADFVAAQVRRAVAHGTAGWRDDDLAFVTGWGFPLATIRPRVAIWQGDQDRMVPVAHGRWLAAHVPTADYHPLAGQGHLSLVTDFGTVVADLARSADRQMQFPQ